MSDPAYRQFSRIFEGKWTIFFKFFDMILHDLNLSCQLLLSLFYFLRKHILLTICQRPLITDGRNSNEM